MPEAVLVTCAGQSDSLRELADTLRYELELQAIPSALHIGSLPEQREGRVGIVMNPWEFSALQSDEDLSDDAVARRTIFICAEMPPASVAGDHLRLLRRAGSVFALDQRSVVALRRLGVTARLLRPGYSASLDRFDLDAARPIDVTFVGWPSGRQIPYLEEAGKVLGEYRCRLANGWTQAEDRWSLLTSTTIVLNLHRDEQTRLEWSFVLDAIHAGAVVVSEHSSGIAPLVAGEHLLVGAPDSLPYLADVLLRDLERTDAIRARAHERLSTWVPFALWVSVLRAAIVELVGEPISTN
jgi:hypothetical protein